MSKKVSEFDIELSVLRKLVDTSTDVICAIGEDGRFISVSKSCFSAWGYEPCELKGKCYLELVDKEDRDKTLQLTKEIIGGKKLPGFGNRYVKKDGAVVTMTWSVNWDEDDRILYCIARDAAGIQTSHATLNLAQERVDKTKRIDNIGFWEFDLVNKKVYWSDELYRIYGIDKKRYPEPSVELYLSLVHKEELQKIQRQLSNPLAIEPGQSVHRIVKPDSSTVYVHYKKEEIRSENGALIFIQGTAEDITLQKACQEELARSEKRFQCFVQHGSDMLGLVDMAGSYLYVSDNVKEILGYDAEFFSGKNAFDFIHPDDKEAVFSHFASVTFHKNVVVSPFRFRDAQGNWKWMETRVTNLMDDPEIEGLVINSRDITDKKLAEDRLKLLSTITEEAPSSIIITDAQFRIVWVNKSFERITQFRIAEVLGKAPFDFLKIEGEAGSIEALKTALKEHRCFKGIFSNYTKTGKKYWMESVIQPIFNNKGELVNFCGINEDITKRLELQEQLNKETEQRQKKVTAAIIKGQEKERAIIGRELHDNVNQVLTTVKIYNELSLDAGADHQSLIKKSIEYLNFSINEIRSLSQALSAPNLSNTTLKESIVQLVNSLNETGKLKATLLLNGVDGLDINEDIHLAVYRIIQEHLTNVLKHAEAGRVTITVAAMGAKLSLAINDNGKGFDMTQKRKGIGITNMFNRVESLDGHLEFKTLPGKGCTIFASFPLKRNGADADRPLP